MFEELYKGLYTPEFTELPQDDSPPQVPPRNFKEITSFNPSRPLTEEEAALVQERLQELRERNAKILNKVQSQKQRIEKEAAGFTVDARLSRRPRLKRAMQKLFGYAPEQITFEMYRQALEIKRRLEIEESEDLFWDSSETS